MGLIKLGLLVAGGAYAVKKIGEHNRNQQQYGPGSCQCKRGGSHQQGQSRDMKEDGPSEPHYQYRDSKESYPQAAQYQYRDVKEEYHLAQPYQQGPPRGSPQQQYKMLQFQEPASGQYQQSVDHLYLKEKN